MSDKKVNWPLGNIYKEILILLGVSIATALVVNDLSPKGIAVFGNWDTTAGVISARPKGYQEALFEEISDVESAKAISDQGEAVFIDARSEASLKGISWVPFPCRWGNFLKKFKYSSIPTNHRRP